MDSLSTVYVPSIGRATTMQTSKLLEKAGIPFYVVTDPCQVAAYASAIGTERVLSVGQDGAGIWFARTWIKRYSESIGEAFHWQVDDDVTGFRWRRAGQGSGNVDPRVALLHTESFIRSTRNVDVASVAPLQFEREKEYEVNRYAHSCEIVRNGTPAYFRPDVIEDLDFVLQVIASGRCTAVTNRYRFCSREHMDQPGGCTESLYLNGRQDALVESTIIRWRLPTTVSRTKQGVARVDMARLWKRLHGNVEWRNA